MPTIRTRALSAAAPLALLALALGASLGIRAGAQSAGASPGPVAVVDLERVINNLDERVARENELKDFIAQRQAVIDQKQQKLKQLQDELNLLPEDAQARQSKAEEVVRARIDFESEQRILEQLLQVKRGEIFKVLFEHVLDAVQRMAQARGYRLVLSNDANATLQSGTDQQLQIQMVSRRVLFADSSLDISDDVVQMLNNEWAAGQGR